MNKLLFALLISACFDIYHVPSATDIRRKGASFGSDHSTDLAETRVHIWIKAFIPKEHPGNAGYIKALPGGKFVIKEPTGQNCALTDNRTFNSNPDASARLTTEFVLAINNNTVKVLPFGTKPISSTGPSHRVNCTSGLDVEPPKNANNNNMHVGSPSFADGIAQVVVDGRAGYPFISVAPDVNYGGHFTYEVATKKIRFQGSTGIFPAFEAYAQLGNGPIKTIFRSNPGAGTTIMSLIELGTGLKQRPVDETVQLQ